VFPIKMGKYSDYQPQPDYQLNRYYQFQVEFDKPNFNYQKSKYFYLYDLRYHIRCLQRWNGSISFRIKFQSYRRGVRLRARLMHNSNSQFNCHVVLYHGNFFDSGMDEGQSDEFDFGADIPNDYIDLNNKMHIIVEVCDTLIEKKIDKVLWKLWNYNGTSTCTNWLQWIPEELLLHLVENIMSCK